MPEQTTMTVETPPDSATQAEWDTSTLWDRIRSGFQGALRHIWSVESQNDPQPAWLLPELPTAQPDPLPVQAETAPPTPWTAPTPACAAWTLVLSDTDNDFSSVLRALWLTGLCDQNGCWTEGLQQIHVVHTGDWLNKWDPNPHVLDGFKRLQETTPEGCQLTLLNGNHELSILQMADQGLRTPLTAEDLAFIRRQHLLHIDRETLFLHGYPSTDLLLILKQFEREGTEREAFNDRLHKVFFDGRYPLFRESRSLHLIGDIKSPRLYYNQKSQNGLYRGRQTAAILQELGLTTVVHGHKPGSETQQDHELQEDIPGIRVINNDNRIRQTGWGGLLLSSQGDTVFINPQALRAAGNEKILRKRLRKLLGTRWKDLHPGMTRSNKATEARRIAA